MATTKKSETAKTAEVKTAAEKKTSAKKTDEKTAAATAKKTPAKKAAAKKAAPAKKAPAKKTAAKTTAAKKTASATKVDVYVEFAGAQVSVDEVIKNVKLTNGKIAKDLTIYIKPDESKAYFVADGEEKEMDVFFC